MVILRFGIAWETVRRAGPIGLPGWASAALQAFIPAIAAALVFFIPGREAERYYLVAWGIIAIVFVVSASRKI
jgi:hypothetical protein